MSVLARVACLSLFASFVVLSFGVVQKVRIDSRAHLAEARSRLERARQTGAPEDYAAVADSCADALASWVPFDRSPTAATALLLEVLPRMPPGKALRAVDRAIVTVDSLALLYAPLVAERELLVASRIEIAARAAARLPDLEPEPQPEPALESTPSPPLTEGSAGE